MKRKLKRGAIYYADLSPIVGSEQDSQRPVLIISNDMGNRCSPTVIAAAITSKIKKALLPTHCPLPASWGLNTPSLVLLEQLRTIDKTRLTRYVGQLDEIAMKEIDTALAISIGLAESANKPKDDTMLLTLCGTCVKDFRAIPEYAVQRVNSKQDFKETCCVCGTRKGWDYLVTNTNC